MIAKFIEKEQDWQNEATRYWFELDGQEYAVVESGPSVTVIDKDGCDINTDDAHNSHLKTALIVTDDMRAQ